MQKNITGQTKHGDEKLVRKFYLRTDIVYTAPGMKDDMTLWENGKKLNLRKHYLVMFLKETFELFNHAYPDVKVAFSKFASLCPVSVLLLKDQQPDNCKCKIHETSH